MKRKCKCGFAGTLMEVNIHIQLLKPWQPLLLSLEKKMVSQENFEKATAEYEKWKEEHSIMEM